VVLRPADPTHDAGYASVAAIGVSLAIAVVVSALMVRGVSSLRLAKADFRRAQAEYALDAASQLAVEQLLNSAGGIRLLWTVTAPGGETVQVLAESEAPKLSLAALVNLSPEALEPLGALNSSEAMDRLSRLSADTATPADVIAVDAATGWKACAASAISPWGQASALALTPTRPPTADTVIGPSGQIWRLRTATEDGWTEERIVRLIGRSEQPSAIIWRSFSRRSKGTGPCQTTITP